MGGGRRPLSTTGAKWSWSTLIDDNIIAQIDNPAFVCRRMTKEEKRIAQRHADLRDRENNNTTTDTLMMT
jgi:hypothetical protein